MCCPDVLRVAAARKTDVTAMTLMSWPRVKRNLEGLDIAHAPVSASLIPADGPQTAPPVGHGRGLGGPAQPCGGSPAGSAGRGALTLTWKPALSSTYGPPGAVGGRSVPCRTIATLPAPCSATCLIILR